MKKLILLSLVFIFVLSASAQKITISGTQFQVDGKRIWLNAANTPWNKWNDFGTGSYNDAWWETHFKSLQQAKINCIRVWISCNGGGVLISADGTVTGVTQTFFNDLDNFFALAQKYKIYIFATLLSFDHTKTDGTPTGTYMRFRNCYNSNNLIAKLADNYFVPFAQRYQTNPYLFGIDICNEIEWTNLNAESGSFPWVRLQYLVGCVAAKVHEHSSVLVSMGSAAVKWSSSIGEANYWKNSALQAQYNNPQAFLDFYSPHYYPWIVRWLGNPCTDKSPEALGYTDRPSIIGECPAKGMFTQNASGTADILANTPTEMYEKAYQNGWQGVFPWSSNGVDVNGSLSNFKAATIAFQTNHPELLSPNTYIAGIQNSPENEFSLANDVKKETISTWNAYLKYAWPHDALLPISKKHYDWYTQPINMSPLDAYSTLKLMGFEKEAKRIENFVIDSLDFNKDVFVKVFEVDIRLLGGLLNIYETTGNKIVLKKAQDFADRLLPAFSSPTGLPYYFINLKTGATKGKIVNVAEAGSYIFEFGLLSYYSENPKYYQIAKKATIKIFSMRSAINLLGRDIDVESGKWTQTQSMVGAYADSYFEYLYKSWLLFKDPEIKAIWDVSITAIQKYIAEPRNEFLWYGKVDMNSGKKVNSEVTLWDAYFPALLALSGDIPRAKAAQKSWNFLWNKENLIPMVYDYSKDSIINPFYQLNPEVIESAYYLWHYTGDSIYYKQVKTYYEDVKKYCKTEIAYCHVENVFTKKQKDEMETFFIAETMKYCYLTFSNNKNLNIDDYVFNTEAHPFKKSDFQTNKIKIRLGLN